ncbi:hypothetical protein Cocul_01170 [Corynebacterium oculi]|uniref:Uncharacterized protein n=1 Tax=Corynebacterium oculi TaxID=1544416 RepID=A0A0Q0YPH9_9CORY|nr:hypothetical protein Cocul_01170 [Corynebacterium oculi]
MFFRDAYGAAEKPAEAIYGNEQVAGEGIGPDLLGSAMSGAVPVFEYHVPEFVGEGAALPHGVESACHADKNGSSQRISHGQPVGIGFCVEYGYVMACGLLDEGDEIT